MVDRRNLFSNIVNVENSYTNLLCNLLQNDVFRATFAQLVSDRCNLALEDKKLLQNFDDYSTQYSFPSNGRPDLVIRNDKVEFYFEVKTNRFCLLTDNQPKGYLNEVDNCRLEGKIAKLIFIVPKGYAYVDEINRQWAAHYKDKPSKHSDKPHIIYWEEIIKLITANHLNEPNAFLSEFVDWISNNILSTPIIFSDGEINIMRKSNDANAIDAINEKKAFSDQEVPLMIINTTPVLISKLFKIIEEVQENINKTGRYYVYTPKGDSHQYYFDVYDKSGNTLLLFIAVWFKFWEQHDAPICFGPCTGKTPNKTIKSFIEQANNGGHAIKTPVDFPDDGSVYLVSFFDSKYFAKSEDCAEDVSKTLIEILDNIA